VAKGELTPHEASDLSSVVQTYLKVLEMVGLAAEVAALKETVAARRYGWRIISLHDPVLLAAA
jgi:hypothetical protein